MTKRKQSAKLLTRHFWPRLWKRLGPDAMTDLSLKLYRAPIPKLATALSESLATQRPIAGNKSNADK